MLKSLLIMFYRCHFKIIFKELSRQDVVACESSKKREEHAAACTMTSSMCSSSLAGNIVICF